MSTRAQPKDDITEAQERRAWELRQREGKTQEQIAEELGIHQSTVSRMLSRVNRRLAKEFATHIEEIRGEHTARLEHVFSEAMAGWRSSRENAETTRTVLERSGVGGTRFTRIEGVADREPFVDDRLDPRNRRISVTLIWTSRDVPPPAAR